MKTIFLVNPAAGASSALEEIQKALSGRPDCEIHVSTEPREATRYIRERCAAEPDRDLRFIACGGDGTINEVASGAAECPNAVMGVYACGSGNDFVRAAGGREAFLDVEAILAGEEQPVDILKVNDDRWAMNAVHFGFDSCVAKTMIEVKRKPIIGGKNAYTTGIVKALFAGWKNRCTLRVDGESFYDGDMLLCSLANGQYVGGGFKCAPRSSMSDGLIEVCLIKPISRLKFPALMGPYQRGEHLDDPRFKDIILYRQAKVVEIEGPAGFTVSLDGEIVENTRFRVEVVPQRIRFSFPKTK